VRAESRQIRDNGLTDSLPNVAQDLQRLSRNQLAAVAWPDRLDYRSGQSAARPAAAPAQRFVPAAPAAPVQVTDLRRQRQELAEKVWPDDMRFAGTASQQGQDDENPDELSQDQKVAQELREIADDMASLHMRKARILREHGITDETK
jgi:hypothetical protein